MQFIEAESVWQNFLLDKIVQNIFFFFLQNASNIIVTKCKIIIISRNISQKDEN